MPAVIAKDRQKHAIQMAKDEAIEKLKLYHKNYFEKKPKEVNCTYIEDMPLVYFATFLFDPELYILPSLTCPDDPKKRIKQTMYSFFDLKKSSIDEMKWQVRPILRMLDEDIRIDGIMASLFKDDEEFFGELIEVLCLTLVHPRRGQILSVEHEDVITLDASPRRSTLREAVVSGRTDTLIFAMDLFLEHAEKQAALKSREKLPALNLILDEIWLLIDIDQDGTLDQEEANELTRSILSRPMLGKLMIAIVAADAANSSWLEAERPNMPSLVGVAVMEMATKVGSVSKSWWEQIDSNLDGNVDEQEFVTLFPLAFLKSVAMPLSLHLAELGQQSHLERLRHESLQEKIRAGSKETHRNCVANLESALSCWDIETDKKGKQTKGGRTWNEEFACDEFNDEEIKHLTGKSLKGQAGRSTDQAAASEIDMYSKEDKCENGCSITGRPTGQTAASEIDMDSKENIKCKNDCSIM